MNNRSAAYGRGKLVVSLLAIISIVGSFFVASTARALENRYGTVLGDRAESLLSGLATTSDNLRYVILLTENISDLSVVPNNGDIVEADDVDSYTEEFIFAPVDETQWLAIFATSESYKIRFETTGDKFNLSLYSGAGDVFSEEEPAIDASLHYYDQSSSNGDKGQIEVSMSAVKKMKIDSDNNGTYEDTPTPSYSLLDSSVTDTEPPLLAYVQDASGLSVSAEDQTGIKNIYYATTTRTGRLVDGAKKYTGTLALSNFSMGDIVYFMAEDTAGNRGFWESYMIIETDPFPSPAPTPYVTPTPEPTGLQINPYLNANIKCGTDIVYYVNMRGEKEAYPSAEIYFSWNTSFDQIVNIDIPTCNSFPDGGLTRVPPNTFVKIAGNKTVWKIDGNVAYPVSSYEVLKRINPEMKIITVPIEYLHTYSGGGAIY